MDVDVGDAAGRMYGRYRVDRQIGLGGMGVVYAATDTVLNRPVAVKVVSGRLLGSAEFRERFQREAEALARLDSPHVISILDHGERDGDPYIATQYVAGGDLGELVRTRGALPVAAAADLCAQVAQGLRDAHRIGIVHRDVKASNVLVRDPDDTSLHVYLCDFGIAKTDGDDHTATGGVAGSWAYLSPERAAGAAATPASDLYATGCLLWVCLTGVAPYGGTDAQVVLAHRDAPVPQLPGADAATLALNDVLRRTMAKDPADRYPDASALEEALRAVARSAPADLVPPTAPTVPPGATRVRAADGGPRRGRRRLVAALAGVAALVVVAVVGVVALGGGDDPAPVVDGPGAAATSGPVTGDVDGDGHGDVLMSQDRTSNLKPVAELVWHSNGTTLASVVSAPRPAPGFLHEADVDGDGRLDLISEGPSTILTDELTLTVAPGSGAAPWAVTLPVPSDTFGILTWQLVDDFNHDGLADVAVSADTEDGRTGMYVALSTGTGFGRLQQWYAGTDQWENAEFYAGDFDGDGLADILVTAPRENGEDWRILRSDGSSMGWAGRSYLLDLPGRALGTPAVGDFDGDGSDEVALFGGLGKAVSVFQVAGGVVQPFTTWAGGLGGAIGNTYGVYTVTDLNGDGLDDLVWRHEPKGGTADLVGLLSTGSAFDAPAPWGVHDCSGECGDTFRFATND